MSVHRGKAKPELRAPSPKMDPERDIGSTPQGAIPKPFINIKFHGSPSQTAVAGTYGRTAGLKFREKRKASDMKKAVLALATAATIGVTALVAPSPAHAWRGGWGPGLAGGLIAGAVIGGIASSAYAYGPGYGYYGGPGYGYYGGYGPTYYGGYADYGSHAAPAYYGGYAPAYYDYGYAPAYRGYRYRW